MRAVTDSLKNYFEMSKYVIFKSILKFCFYHPKKRILKTHLNSRFSNPNDFDILVILYVRGRCSHQKFFDVSIMIDNSKRESKFIEM